LVKIPIKIATSNIINKSQMNILIATAAAAPPFAFWVLARSYGDGAAKRKVKIRMMNKRGNQDTPHQTGPKGIIQYCEAIPAINKMKKNSKSGA
jgi:hypothetical protein